MNRVRHVSLSGLKNYIHYKIHRASPYVLILYPFRATNNQLVHFKNISFVNSFK